MDCSLQMKIALQRIFVARLNCNGKAVANDSSIPFEILFPISTLQASSFSYPVHPSPPQRRSASGFREIGVATVVRKSFWRVIGLEVYEHMVGKVDFVGIQKAGKVDVLKGQELLRGLVSWNSLLRSQETGSGSIHAQEGAPEIQRQLNFGNRVVEVGLSRNSPSRSFSLFTEEVSGISPDAHQFLAKFHRLGPEIVDIQFILNVLTISLYSGFLKGASSIDQYLLIAKSIKFTSKIVHGEPFITDILVGPSSGGISLVVNDKGDTNPYRNMVLDAMRNDDAYYNDRVCSIVVIEEPSNLEASNFFKLLKAAEEPLWEGCTKQSKLSACVQLLNMKSNLNLTQNAFNKFTEFAKSCMPDDANLVSNFYDAKKFMRPLGLGYEKYDVCPNYCMLYYGVDAMKINCDLCGSSRYKPRNPTSKGSYKAEKQLRYFPLTPRL
uniref:Uncharacterized protein n=1 Tax=Salix viminalis TaxID=40686 RepID=A0A6N2KNU2_SALVM